MTTGEILKAFREGNNLSQEAVASFLVIKGEVLSYYENDSREAPIEVLEKLANLYGVDLADFFETEHNQIKTNIAFALGTNGIEASDLNQIAQFRKVVKNYLTMIVS
jgi:transcriptional regulator with XRE-family HTH domain